MDGGVRGEKQKEGKRRVGASGGPQTWNPLTAPGIPQRPLRGACSQAGPTGGKEALVVGEAPRRFHQLRQQYLACPTHLQGILDNIKTAEI